MRNVVLASLMLFAAAAWAQNPRVEMKTSAGRIVIEVDAANAPKTAANFLQYAKDGFYDGTIFHRVIDGFMIQGGGFDKNFKEKNTRAPVVNEASSGVKAGMMNKLGTVAMARTSDPNSATAQFFINVNDNDFLNWGNPRGDGNGYAVFGKVVSGLEVVNKIAKLPTGAGGPMSRDVPKQPVIIESATVVGAK